MACFIACEKKTELPIISKMPDFQLTNQLGAPVSLGSYQGKIWLADIIFTRCPGPCPLMSQTMAGLAETLPKKPAIRLLPLPRTPNTTHPKF